MRNWSRLFIVAALFALAGAPALAGRVDESTLGDIDNFDSGGIIWSDTFTWNSGNPDFSLTIQSDVYFDEGSGVYTYVFGITVHATNNVTSGISFGGDWDTIDFPADLNYGIVGAGLANFLFTSDFFRASFFDDPLSNGESITLYAQSFRPPIIFSGDSLDGGDPAPFGEAHGPSVPEPGTLVLMGSGLLLLGGSRAFRKRF